MTRVELVGMAHAAGLSVEVANIGDLIMVGWPIKAGALERFAALVAAAEREACAKIVDEANRSLDTTFAQCAAAIRARTD